jgi:hypothetical protein
MLLPGEQVWRRRAHDALERDGNLLEGALDSRSRWGLARGGVQPPSEAESHLRGRPTLERGGTLPEGATGPRVRRICLARVFYEFKWVFPSCLGDPHGYPRQRSKGITSV